MLTPPICTVIVSFPGAAGALYVVVHTPWLHTTALKVPPPGGGVIWNDADVAVNTGLLNPSLTRIVTSAVPFTAILFVLIVTDDLTALGTSATTVILRRITTRPAESSRVLSGGPALRTARGRTASRSRE